MVTSNTNAMQCKDIPDLPILEYLARIKREAGRWCFFGFAPDIFDAFPADAPYNLVLAKMKKLITKGLVSGCACGCSGNFAITELGAGFIHNHATEQQDKKP